MYELYYTIQTLLFPSCWILFWIVCMFTFYYFSFLATNMFSYYINNIIICGPSSKTCYGNIFLTLLVLLFLFLTFFQENRFCYFIPTIPYEFCPHYSDFLLKNVFHEIENKISWLRTVFLVNHKFLSGHFHSNIIKLFQIFEFNFFWKKWF